MLAIKFTGDTKYAPTTVITIICSAVLFKIEAYGNLT